MKEKEDKKLLDESQKDASQTLRDSLSALEDTVEDTLTLRELKSKLNNSHKVIKETRLKIGLQAAFLEPILANVSDRLHAIKCSGELGADAFQKDKQLELLHKQAHHLLCFITRTKTSHCGSQPEC